MTNESEILWESYSAKYFNSDSKEHCAFYEVLGFDIAICCDGLNDIVKCADYKAFSGTTKKLHFFPMLIMDNKIKFSKSENHQDFNLVKFYF